MDITLKLIREMKGLKQAAAADLLGVSQSAYSKIERGITRLSKEKLEEFLSRMGCDPDQLEGDYSGKPHNPHALREAFYKELLKNYQLQMKYLREENQTLRQQLFLLFKMTG